MQHFILPIILTDMIAELQCDFFSNYIAAHMLSAVVFVYHFLFLTGCDGTRLI